MALIRKVLPLSVILALISTTFLTNISPRYFADIRIHATGKKSSEDAKGTAVWMSTPRIRQLQQKFTYIRKSTGWEIRDGIFISTRNQPAELSLQGYLGETETIQFFTTPYSGTVELELNGITTVVDLFRDSESGIVTIPMNRYFSGSRGIYFPAVLEYLALFLRNLLMILVILIAIHPFYAQLPSPRNIHTFQNQPGIAKSHLFLLFLAVPILGLFCLAFYPGVVRADASWQYLQAVGMNFDDWNPPIMAAVWSIVDKFIKGAGGMFLLQLLMVICSVYLLSEAAHMRNKKLYWAPFVFPFLPVVSCILFSVMKDVVMACSLLLTFSLWYFWRSTGRLSKSKMILILFPAFYASCVRYNALSAIFPLLFIFLLDFTIPKRAILNAVLLSAFFYFGHNFLVYQMIGATRHYWFQTIQTHDLMGIYALTNKNYLPATYLSKNALDQVMPGFDHTTYETTIPLIDSMPTSDARLIDLLKRRWRTAIIEQPLAYLKHRWILYKNFLLRMSLVMLPVSVDPPDVLRDRPPLLEQTVLGKIHTDFIMWFSYKCALLFKPVTYVVASCVVFLIAFRKRIISAAALCASSLFYLLPYFFVAPTSDYRFIYWSVFATILSLVVLWIEKDPQPHDKLSFR